MVWRFMLSRCTRKGTGICISDCKGSRYRIELNRKATRVGTFEVCVSTHVSLRMFIISLCRFWSGNILASQLPFLANRNAELAVPPLVWPVNCIKIGGHVVLLSGPTVYTLYCAHGLSSKSSKSKIFRGRKRLNFSFGTYGFCRFLPRFLKVFRCTLNLFNVNSIVGCFEQFKQAALLRNFGHLQTTCFDIF